MNVDRHKALTKGFGEQTLYFCSQRGLDAFEAGAAGGPNPPRGALAAGTAHS